VIFIVPKRKGRSKMKKRKLTVKVGSLDEALADFKTVWEKSGGF
jgi:hypothetical protein